MKYTPSALVSVMSGAQGSTVASHNRFGPYFRNRVIPVNTNTLPQQDARNNLAYASAQWRNLSSGDQAAWQSAALSVVLYDRLGRAYTPTGQQYFVSVARTLFVYSGVASVSNTPPASPTLTALTSLLLAADESTPSLEINFTATPIGATHKMIIEATRPLSAGVNFVPRSEFRQIAVSAANDASPTDYITDYVAKFGSIDVSIIGKKTFFRCTIIGNDGARSAPLVASAIWS